MKAKALITDDDYVVNPAERLFGDRIPKFTFPESGHNEFVDGRAGMNYGAFLVEKLANKRANPILNLIVNHFFGDDEKVRNAAYEELRKVAEEYKQL